MITIDIFRGDNLIIKYEKSFTVENFFINLVTNFNLMRYKVIFL